MKPMKSFFRGKRTFAPLLILIVSGSVSAEHVRDINWGLEREIDFKKIIQENFLEERNLYYPRLTEKRLEKILKDPDDRIPEPFKVPEFLKKEVRFWFKVYTLYSSHQVVLFDKRHPDVTYEVLDFRPIYEKYKNRPVAYEITRKKELRKKMRQYRRAMRQLARKNFSKKKYTDVHRNIVKAVKRFPHPQAYKYLPARLMSQTGQRNHILEGLERASPYFEVMEQIFEANGLPKELTRISLVESSFNSDAISRAGAVGAWQFLYNSGREFMVVERNLDERMSPIKSTMAAAKLLKRNKYVLDEWALAVSSYHYGLRTFLRWPKRYRVGDKVFKLFSGCVHQKRRIGYAGRNYFVSFLALLHADKYRERVYGRMQNTEVLKVAFHQVKTRRTLSKLAARMGVPLQKLKELNPELKYYNQKIPRGYWLVIPDHLKSKHAISSAEWVKNGYQRPTITYKAPKARKPRG